jgi:ubiquinone/menaquinone biosynthesis C-methylase UbiE
MRALKEVQASNQQGVPVYSWYSNTYISVRLPPEDAFVMLDPTVEILEVEVDEYQLLCHTHFEVSMAVPPGEGLIVFVTALMEGPVRVKDLRAEFDEQELVDKMLASLCLHGFVHVTLEAKPTLEELAHLRELARQTREKTLRRSIVLDLDAPTTIEQLCARLNAEVSAPELLLRCARLAEHKTTLKTLADLRQAGTVRMYRTAVQTTELTSDSDICQSLIRLGGAVYLEGAPWNASNYRISGLQEMTRSCVPVHALMTPDLSILDETVRARVIEWAGSVFVSGLRLQFGADALWPDGDVTGNAFIEVFDAVRALEDEFGDVQIANLPSDDVLLGNTESSSCPAELSDVANRFRISYLRWRIPLLKSCELDNTWSQTPEAEEKLVHVQEDLLPNHPELLLLRRGSFVVDVCGGLGRNARRLAPAVGKEGLIISIEMLRCISDRGRHFACERNMMNLDFRPGLAERIPLPDSTVDAAVNEWTAGIWEFGIGRTMVAEMARVVRPGGRIAVTHRLVRIPLTQLGQRWAQYEEIYSWMCDAFVHPELTVIATRVWGQIVSSLVGENATFWRKQFMPRLINPYDFVYENEDFEGAHADIYLTMIAERH